MNNITVVGNLTRDPELRKTTNGISVCTFTVACNRTHKEGADFFRVVTWRAQADTCNQYLKKGRKVAVQGAMESRSYEKDGQKREIWELQADEVEFLSTGQKDAPDMKPVDDPDDPFNDMPF